MTRAWELLLGLLGPALQPAQLRQQQAGLEGGACFNCRAGQPLREREVVALPGSGGR
jgi:hypothetical protein